MTTKRRSFRFGLRLKLILFSLVLALAPLLAIWPVGLVEGFLRREIAWEIDRCADELVDEVRRQGLERIAGEMSAGSSAPRERGVDADADADDLATVNGARAGARWIHRFAERHHVMIRVLDRRGQVVLRTSPRHAERWANVRDLWQGLDDIFYGPTGPPDLLAYESRLPAEGRRPEVHSALAGGRASQWRYDSEARMFVYTAAVPLPQGGAVTVTRISRRVIRSLYDMRYQLLKLTLFLMTAAILFGLYIGRRMVAPLISMQRTIGAYLKNPGRSAPPSIVLKRSDEIGDLSRSFHELTSRLQRHVEETASVAGDLAHDLKGPIATVAATAELLESSSSITSERQQRLSEALSNAALHMGRSVDGLLALARLDEQLTSLDPARVELRPLIERVVAELRATPRCEGIEIDVDLGDTAPTIMGDETQIELLLRNLLENAVTFCAAAVQVTLRERAVSIHLTICDDGPGVSRGNREKIFRRFFSARPESSPPGTGLGLSIVTTVARAHGGTVELLETSEEQGLSGACFRVTLPAE